jgi:hypothetical protein
MSDQHVNPNGFEPAQDEAQGTNELGIEVGSDLADLPVTECQSLPINAIHRPEAPDPAVLRDFISRKTAGNPTEADIMQMAIDTTPTEEEPTHGDPFVPSGEVSTSSNLGPQTEAAPLIGGEHLGIADGNLDNDPRFDTVTPMHDPVTPEEITNTLQMSKDDLAAPVAPPKSQSLQMTVKTPPVTPTPVAPVITDTVTVEAPAIISTPEPAVEVEPVVDEAEVVDTEASLGFSIGAEQLATPVIEVPVSTDELIPVDNEPVSASIDPVALKEIHDAIPPYLVDPTTWAGATTEETTPAPEDNPLVVLTAPSHTEVADQLLGNGAGQELDAALQDLPIVEQSPDDDLIKINPDQVSAVVQEELTIDDAMNLVTETTGKLLFSDDYQELTDLPSLVGITTPEPNKGELVIPLMDADTLSQLAFQTNPVLLSGTNKELFGDADPVIYNQLQQKIVNLNEKLVDPSSYLYRIRMAHEFIDTDTTNFNTRVLNKAFERHKEQTGKDLKLSRSVALKNPNAESGEELKYIDDSYADKEKLLSRLGNQVSLAGSVAFKTASLLINGIRKVNLYHSGFNVVICAPRLDLLTKYSNAVRANAGDYGRIMGKLAFLPVGVEIRSALFDLFEKVVVDSNLEGWDQPGTLRNAISSLDYSTILWGIASLMYPQGVDVEYVCYNKIKGDTNCHHTEKATVNINNMRFNNWSMLNAESITYVDSKTKRTLADLKMYREKYLNSTLCWEPISEDGCWKAAFSIPTVAEAEEAQRSYVAELISTIQINKVNELNQYVQAKYLNSFVPYVQQISYTHPKKGTVIYFKDGAALANALDNLQLLPGLSLGDKIVEFISSKTITHICFAHHPCPVCGKYPKEAINRLIACDPEYAFFQWATSRIPR